MAVEEEPNVSGAFDIAGGSDQQHPYRHQEANRRPEQEGMELELQRELGCELQDQSRCRSQ